MGFPFFSGPIKAPTLADLQGQWRAARVGKNGNKAPFFLMWMVHIGMRVEKDHYQIVAQGNVVEEGRLVVSPRGEYSVIEQHIEAGDDAGKLQRGFVRLVGAKLEHLQGEAGGEAPTGFPYGPQSKANFALLKRV